MNITFAGLTLGALALCGVYLVSCSPQRPAAQYRVSPQGPHEQAVAQAFEALVRAYARQDWDDVMALIADDAQIEPAVPDAAGPSGVDSPRVINKHEYGQAIKPIIARMRGYHVENVKLMTVNPTQVLVSGTVTLLMAGKPSLQNRDRLWVFENRGERWLVVRAQYL
ncbi:MAG TPA: nuclear transport factor 2 family protein [Candidatus Tectomicrobia bacterium]|nr:nuclear transport factor 2 family protein [Candidatus Tectomicrobia bacterium]